MKRKVYRFFAVDISSMNHPFIVTLLYLFAFLFIATPIALGSNKVQIMSLSHDITQQALNSNMGLHLIAAALCFIFGTYLGIQNFKKRFPKNAKV